MSIALSVAMGCAMGLEVLVQSLQLALLKSSEESCNRTPSHWPKGKNPAEVTSSGTLKKFARQEIFQMFGNTR